jgi:hypothetical protein
LAGGAHAKEGVEEMGDRLPDLRVGIERHVAGLVIDQAGWKGKAYSPRLTLLRIPGPSRALNTRNLASLVVPLRHNGT